jgi:hypothetical protein
MALALAATDAFSFVEHSQRLSDFMGAVLELFFMKRSSRSHDKKLSSSHAVTFYLSLPQHADNLFLGSRLQHNFFHSYFVLS